MGALPLPTNAAPHPPAQPSARPPAPGVSEAFRLGCCAEGAAVFGDAAGDGVFYGCGERVL